MYLHYWLSFRVMMIKFVHLLSVILTFYLMSLIEASETEEPKWQSPILFTTSKRLRQASKAGFSDIYFKLGDYFLKVFDYKCFRGADPKHKELVNRASTISDHINEYVKRVIKDKKLVEQMNTTFKFVKSINTIYKKLNTTEEINEKTIQDLHNNAKNFKDLLLKKNIPVKSDNFLNQLILKQKSNEINENCEYHSSGQALGTGFITSLLIGMIQMARIEYKFQNKTEKYSNRWNEMKSIFGNYLAYSSDSMYAAAINGTKGTFSCRNDKYQDLKESYKIFIGKVEADKDNVIAGVKFYFESNTLFIQIKQGKLLPFGQVVPEDDWKPVKSKPSKDETIQFNSKCRFLLSRQNVSPNQVLVGVQIRHFEEWESGKCFYTIVAHGRKADLLEGNLYDYRSQFFVSRPIYTYTTERSYLYGGDVHVAALPFTKRNNVITPFIDIFVVETVPSTAHGGLEVFVTYQKGVFLLRLRLYSVNIAQHLGSFLHLKELPEYYYSYSSLKEESNYLGFQ